MLIVYGIIILLFLFLFILSEKRSRNPFENMAVYLYRELRKGKVCSSGQVKRDVEMLHPGLNGRTFLEDYYISKINRVLIVLFAGDVAAIAVCLGSLGGGVLKEGKYIDRNTYGEGSFQASLQARIIVEDKAENQEFNITVKERMYEGEMIGELAADAAKRLPAVMLGNNPSEEEVRENLNLVNGLEGSPFHIAWESDNYTLIYSDGTVINDQVSDNGEIVNLTAILTYENYKEENIFTVRVCPPVLSKAEQVSKKVWAALLAAEERDRHKEKVSLPERIGKLEIGWQEKREDSSGYILLLIAIGAIGIYFLQDKDLHEKVRLRNAQMLMDYPGIVNKLSLYMGAGMTIRGAFCKIAYDYKAEKTALEKQKYRGAAFCRYAYEEMLITCHELESGIGETQAYAGFRKRCRMIQYTKLSNLLSQNLKKGSNGILSALRQEAANAFEERKGRARKLGEEAGTKLLLPMMLMFGVVMILIIVPAYFSFSI